MYGLIYAAINIFNIRIRYIYLPVFGKLISYIVFFFLPFTHVYFDLVEMCIYIFFFYVRPAIGNRKVFLSL